MRRLLVGLALLLIVAGTYLLGQNQAQAPVGEPPASTAPTSTLAQPPAPMTRRARVKPRPPRHLVLSGIEAPVIPLELTSTVLVPPSDPKVLGWWGKRAGARHGTTLLVGHTVHTGGGALDHLGSVSRVGATVDVSGVRYKIVSNRDLSKSQLARGAEHLFAQSGPHRLVVVTCTDYQESTHEYLSNTVVVAQPI